MGKGARLKRSRRPKEIDIKKKFAEHLTKNFQKQLRNSEIWDQMVAEFGEDRPEKILKECKAEVKPGFES